MPHVCELPTAIDVNLSPPETATGTVLAVSVPFPSCPRKLLPQHHAAPSVSIAHVNVSPALIDENFFPPDTGAGSETMLPVVPFPIAPLRLSPQQYAVPSAARAHA